MMAETSDFIVFSTMALISDYIKRLIADFDLIFYLPVSLANRKLTENCKLES